MAFKLIAFAACVAAANAGALPYAYQASHYAPVLSAAAPLAYAPVAKAVVADAYEHEYDPHPQYSYSYDVHDSLTGDAKSQHETRNGDVVEGSYSFIEADGSRRVVHYTADDHNGFNAVVEKQPAAVKVATPVAVKVAAPVYKVAQPILKIAEPVAHASYAAPVYKVAQPVLKVAEPVAHASYATPVVYQQASPVVYQQANPVVKLAYAAPALAHSYHH